MSSSSALRFVGLHAYLVGEGLGQVVAVLFQLAPSAFPVRRVHLGCLSGPNPLRKTGDGAIGVAVPFEFRQQLLHGHKAKAPRPLSSGRGLIDDGAYRSLDGDGRFLVEPMLQPVVDMPRSGLALHPPGELGLGAADGNGAL